MVERDLFTKNHSECDVKDEPVANGRGSKDLELAGVKTFKDIGKVIYWWNKSFYNIVSWVIWSWIYVAYVCF